MAVGQRHAHTLIRAKIVKMVENGGKTKVLLINTTNGESDFIHLLHRLR